MYVSAYVEFRQISSIRQYLTVEADKTLVCAFLYYLAVPFISYYYLQKVQNYASKLSTICHNFWLISCPSLWPVSTLSRQFRSADTRILNNNNNT